MFIVSLVTLILIVLSVVIHYEVLYSISHRMDRRVGPDRRRILLGVCGTLLAHLVEIILFALGYLFLLKSGNYGSLEGSYSQGFQDAAYYSFVAYTSLGFGDITPVGPIRFLTALETLTGLLMIAWTASFLFMQMQRYWNIQAPD